MLVELPWSVGFYEGLNELIRTNYTEKHVAQGKCLINFSEYCSPSALHTWVQVSLISKPMVHTVLYILWKKKLRNKEFKEVVQNPQTKTVIQLNLLDSEARPLFWMFCLSFQGQIIYLQDFNFKVNLKTNGSGQWTGRSWEFGINHGTTNHWLEDVQQVLNLCMAQFPHL